MSYQNIYQARLESCKSKKFFGIDETLQKLGEKVKEKKAEEEERELEELRKKHRVK